MPDSDSASVGLYELLDDKLEECPISEKRYLPLGVLDELITAERVLATLNSSIPKGHSNTSHIPERDTIAANVVKHAKKLFTILLFIGEQQRHC